MLEAGRPGRHPAGDGRAVMSPADLFPNQLLPLAAESKAQERAELAWLERGVGRRRLNGVCTMGLLASDLRYRLYLRLSRCGCMPPCHAAIPHQSVCVHKLKRKRGLRRRHSFRWGQEDSKEPAEALAGLGLGLSAWGQVSFDESSRNPATLDPV